MDNFSDVMYVLCLSVCFYVLCFFLWAMLPEINMQLRRNFSTEFAARENHVYQRIKNCSPYDLDKVTLQKTKRSHLIHQMKVNFVTVYSQFLGIFMRFLFTVLSLVFITSWTFLRIENGGLLLRLGAKINTLATFAIHPEKS